MLNPVQRNPLTFLGGQPTGKKQLLAGDLLILRADDLGTHDGLVQVQNTIELSCGLGGRGGSTARSSTSGLRITISSYARMIKPLLWAKRLWDFHSRRFIVPYT